MKKVSFKQMKDIAEADRREEEKTVNAAKAIIGQVRNGGDKALLRLTEKHDGVRNLQIKVSPEEIMKAKEGMDKALLQAVKTVLARVENYHRMQMPKGFEIKEKGVKTEFRFSPVKKAGIYIPGGQAPLISTILMTVPAAKIAGVERIFAASPPSFNGKIHPAILGTLGFLGIKDIFAIGGAQAIAALALGTETVPKADIIAGPGNRYVNAAKKLLYGTVGMDIPAGPSEVAIFSDSTGNKDFIAADLLAQAEHTDGKSIFITTSRVLGEEIGKRVKGGLWLHAKNRKEAVEALNHIAPEHLQLFCKNPEDIVEKTAAGAVFIGNYSPAALGDYFAGPSHVLPTDRTARFASGLSVYTFLRSYAVIKAEKSFYGKNGKIMQKLALAEGLAFHADALAARTKRSKGEKK